MRSMKSKKTRDYPTREPVTLTISSFKHLAVTLHFMKEKKQNKNISSLFRLSKLPSNLGELCKGSGLRLFARVDD